MNQALAVTVTPLPVRMVTLGGAEAHAVVFLHEASRRGPGPETLGERLSADDTFFLPCIVERGVELINLEHVAYIQAALDLPEVEKLEEVPSFRAAATLELSHGERLSGELRYRLPPGRCRISDLFNAVKDRFVLLTGEVGSVYVNRRAVVRVRTEDPSCR
jgi:hypothetical protein